MSARRAANTDHGRFMKPAPTLADVIQIVSTQGRQIEALTGRIALLEAVLVGAGARDAADEALMVGAVAIVGLGHTLQAQDLIDRAQADEDFRALLLAADIVETTELGTCFAAWPAVRSRAFNW